MQEAKVEDLPTGPYGLFLQRRDLPADMVEVCSPHPVSPWLLRHLATVYRGDDLSPEESAALLRLWCQAPRLLDAVVASAHGCLRCNGTGRYHPREEIGWETCPNCRLARAVLTELDALPPQPVRGGYLEAGVGVDAQAYLERVGADSVEAVGAWMENATMQCFTELYRQGLTDQMLAHGSLRLAVIYEPNLSTRPYVGTVPPHGD